MTHPLILAVAASLMLAPASTYANTKYAGYVFDDNGHIVSAPSCPSGALTDGNGHCCFKDFCTDAPGWREDAPDIPHPDLSVLPYCDQPEALPYHICRFREQNAAPTCDPDWSIVTVGGQPRCARELRSVNGAGK